VPDGQRAADGPRPNSAAWPRLRFPWPAPPGHRGGGNGGATSTPWRLASSVPAARSATPPAQRAELRRLAAYAVHAALLPPCREGRAARPPRRRRSEPGRLAAERCDEPPGPGRDARAPPNHRGGGNGDPGASWPPLLTESYPAACRRQRNTPPRRGRGSQTSVRPAGDAASGQYCAAGHLRTRTAGLLPCRGASKVPTAREKNAAKSGRIA
jgi:hypothetical protein